MRFQAPEFWTRTEGRDAAPGLRALLTPISWLYAYLTQRRIDKTVAYNPGIPVVCIGNVTAGGTGKTPVTAEILSMLRAQKIRAEGLSRGYGGTERGPVKVSSDHDAATVGDEPLLLSARAPVWVAVSRDDGARAMAASGAQVIVMDDGHQNPALEKTLSIVVVDAQTGFGNGRVMPAGPLREPVTRSLARADAVILMKPDRDFAASSALLKQLSGLPVIEAYLTPTAPLPPGPLFAFAGIGRPNKFFDALRAAGANVVEAMGFADHFAYSPADMAHLQAMAREYKAQLITTEKDFVRIPPSIRQYVAVWPVRCVFQDELAIERLLSPIIDSVKKGR
ncbi:tetraacyldisaccharide 4'-kinase [Robiginitomaculum antarcticum]|uniref:tetraacyldisaccharide 4'-kinase n=1 Tax=Robiginitomaculum antarcticum TaxID=437507 RepID=UPI00036F02A0|nr:tetraacyldisaccharide 4'-kinase [Robiginitomaculum antarcticum]